MKFIKISLIILGSVSLIYLGACGRNPFKNKHDGDKKDYTPEPKKENTDKDKKKHSEEGSSQQQKIVKTLISFE